MTKLTLISKNWRDLCSTGQQHFVVSFLSNALMLTCFPCQVFLFTVLLHMLVIAAQMDEHLKKMIWTSVAINFGLLAWVGAVVT